MDFKNKPLAGIDGDNIYSMPNPIEASTYPFKIATGVYPGTNSQNKGCPGYRGINGSRNSSTDTVLIP